MEDFFENEKSKVAYNDAPLALDAPLATRMRPRSLQEYIGQQHLLAEGKLLRRSIEGNRITSMIFYGPPGTGKTSLARVIASSTQSDFVEMSGIEGSVADLRKVIAEATHRARLGKKTLLFIDEIHRFNKTQQDVLLPDVEKGTVCLIGATTQNPTFSVIAPLLSRSQIFQLEPLSTENLVQLQQQALSNSERGLGHLPIDLEEEAAFHLARVSDGDARKCLNSLELAAMTTKFNTAGRLHITRIIAEESIQQKTIVYDRDGDAHYDTISAFIKSIRGTDPDAAIYWLGKMLLAGEDPRFIARRLVIAASEDIGLADPRALPLAIATKEAVEFLGLPEARIPLAHATLYLATAPKSNSAYAALEKVTAELKKSPTLTVPKHLRDNHYAGATKLGAGAGYRYPHDYPNGYVPQDYLPEAHRYYHPTQQGAEALIIKRLAYLKNLPL